ncbi:MAG TPA: hypothetical protein ENH12_04015 [Proteobacteria bacterium]|nr:hypothetical protein [Pseudomonadota bacterium]
MTEEHRKIEENTGRPWWDQKEEDMKCPRCGSNAIDERSWIDIKDSGTSTPKGIAGGLPLGKKGAPVSGLPGSDKPAYEKYHHCQDCGHEWK